MSADKLISETISAVVNYQNCCDIHPDAVVLHSEENKDTAIYSVTELSKPVFLQICIYIPMPFTAVTASALSVHAMISLHSTNRSPENFLTAH